MARKKELIVWIAVAVVAVVVLVAVLGSNRSSLPQSSTMSPEFKAAVISSLPFKSCAINVEPKNTEDERLRRLFDDCFDYDRQMIDLRAHPYVTESDKDKYNSLSADREESYATITKALQDDGIDANSEREKWEKSLTGPQPKP